MMTSEPFVVEVWGHSVGLVTEDAGTFRFRAVAPPFHSLNDKKFAAPGYARVAAARLYARHVADEGSAGSSLEGCRAVQMHEFIRRQTVEHFRKLVKTTDRPERAILEALLTKGRLTDPL
jgi:hypothetical protein